MPSRTSRIARQLAGAGYLAASTVAALNAANAASPLARTGRASVGAFFAGVVPSELPVQTIGITAIETAVALRTGAGRTRTGLLGLALSAGATAALTSVYLKARPAPDILEQALQDALGPDYRERIVNPSWPSTDDPEPSNAGLVQMLRAHRRYAQDSDISYGPAGKRNRLDVWHRPDLPKDGRAPVLVQVHGGAWIYGQKTGQAYPLMSHLVERGWICVALNYRLSPRATWPDHILDVKRAVAWVKENIADYGGDPEFVAITGGSAGGHLTALHALTAQDRRWQPGFEDVDTTVAAAVPFYGVYDWTNRDGTGSNDLLPMLEKHVVKSKLEANHQVFDEASPMAHVRPDSPPWFSLHGTNDTLVPVAQARAFVQMMRDTSTEPVAYAEFPGAQHAFDVFSSLRANASAAAVARFLGVVYGDHVRTREDAGQSGGGSVDEGPEVAIPAPS